MKKLFNETITSIQDKKYGQQIVQKPVRETVLYWSKYILIFSALYLAMIIVTVTYQLPQLPKMVRQSFPQGELISKSGKLTSTFAETKLISSEDFSLTIDSKAKVEDPQSLPSGLLLTGDTVYFKSPDSPVQTIKLSELPEFSLSKDGIIKWLNENQVKLWAAIVAAVLVMGVILTGLYIGIQLISMLIWAVIFLIIGQFINKKISYKDIFKLVVFASVPWLIISNITSLLPSPIFVLVNLGVFIFFVILWMKNIPLESEPKKVHTKK